MFWGHMAHTAALSWHWHVKVCGNHPGNKYPIISVLKRTSSSNNNNNSDNN